MSRIKRTFEDVLRAVCGPASQVARDCPVVTVTQVILLMHLWRAGGVRFQADGTVVLDFRKLKQRKRRTDAD